MKPIGYWLNRTDRALTSYMDGMLAEFGLTRISWQVLNIMEEAAETTDTHVRSLLASNADVPTLSAAVDTAVADGWATRPAPGRLALLPEGRARLAEVAERVHRFRELSMTGISLDEYRTAISVLERMTRNLEPPAGR
jgi:DNA-binding MarR family transcriptional regulator